MSLKPVRWGAGPLKTNTLDTAIGFKPRELAKFGEYGQVDQMMVMRCRVKVTAGGSVSAMNETQRKIFLSKFTLDLRYDGNEDTVKASTQDKDNPLHPYQQAKFTELGRVSRRLVEKYVKGFEDATTGLAQSFTAGTITLVFDVYVSLGHIEFIRESKELLGIGPSKLANTSIEVKKTADYLNTLSNQLTFNELEVEFIGLRSKARGDRFGAGPTLRRYTPTTTAYDVETVRGAPLDAVDMRQPLASTNKAKLTVTVGDNIVNKPPDKPSTIHANYVDFNPDVGTVESAIASEVTPVYELPDMSVLTLRTGRARFVLEEASSDGWDLQSTQLPFMGAEQVLAEARAAAARLPSGVTMSLVHTAKLVGLPVETGNAGLCAVTGYTGFLSTDPEATKYPCLRMDRAGNIDVYVPPEYRERAVKAYLGAKSNTASSAAGDAAGMDAAVHLVAVWVAGTCDDEVKGLPRSDGTGGPESIPYRMVRNAVERDVATIERAQAA